jgi:hypothetical protein
LKLEKSNKNIFSTTRKGNPLMPILELLDLFFKKNCLEIDEQFLYVEGH